MKKKGCIYRMETNRRTPFWDKTWTNMKTITDQYLLNNCQAFVNQPSADMFQFIVRYLSTNSHQFISQLSDICQPIVGHLSRCMAKRPNYIFTFLELALLSYRKFNWESNGAISKSVALHWVPLMYVQSFWYAWKRINYTPFCVKKH